jgi:hypothetical protein
MGVFLYRRSYQITITPTNKSDTRYVIAEILSPNLVANFTIGDGKYYNGHYNAPLKPGSTYIVFVRAVIKAAQNGVSVMQRNWILTNAIS